SYENMKSDNTPSFFGTTAQNDQSWLALCIGLVKEDHKLEAAYCSRHLQTEADRDEFRRAFGGYLLVGGAAPREPNLQVIKDGNRHRFITNDLSLLRVKHLKPSPIPPAWHALRFPPEESDVPLSVR
ncbi:MAG TPA: hypothetical protein VMU55_01710, partial [Solirubrobacteraceae bacterium]|nr:hypothetical protein [Solirubrobacteraceae bacterium]